MITIHGIPISVHARKAIVTATLKGIAHAVEPVIPFAPPPGWDMLSPTGLIPAMQDGSFTLAESTAICLYLERKQPLPSILPGDVEGDSRAMFLDGYAGWMFRSLVHGLFFQKVIGPRILKRDTDQAAIDQILASVRPRVFQYLDSLAGGRFLVGSGLSLADLGIVSNLINYQYLGFHIDRTAYPRLARYADGIIGLDAFRQALAKEAPFAEQMGLDRRFLD
jgi:glutathione S-transferase